MWARAASLVGVQLLHSLLSETTAVSAAWCLTASVLAPGDHCLRLLGPVRRGAFSLGRARDALDVLSPSLSLSLSLALSLSLYLFFASETPPPKIIAPPLSCLRNIFQPPLLGSTVIRIPMWVCLKMEEPSKMGGSLSTPMI